jgi:N-acetylmuramoyl-L-alanine amidase
MTTHRIWFFCHRLCLILLFSPATWAFHVILDPGHGGNDRGTTRGFTQEKDITLNISKVIQKEMLRQGWQVSLTREKDRFVSLQDRTDFAEKKGADLFISIHVNSSPDKKVRGFEVYFQNPLPADEESLFLAAREEFYFQKSTSQNEPNKKADVLSILEDLHRQVDVRRSHLLSRNLSEHLSENTNKTVVRQAPYYVLLKSSTPSVLLELGYLTHDQDREKLKDPQYHQWVATRLTEGVKNFKEMMDKSKSQSLK